MYGVRRYTPIPQSKPICFDITKQPAPRHRLRGFIPSHTHPKPQGILYRLLQRRVERRKPIPILVPSNSLADKLPTKLPKCPQDYSEELTTPIYNVTLINSDSES